MPDDEKSNLYRRITQQPPHLALERMRIHGFWPVNQPLPPDPPAELAQRAELEKELDELRKQHSIVKDPQKALSEERKRRWAESKKRRTEKKSARQQAHKEWLTRWNQCRAQTITHLGEGVSAGLENNLSNPATLAANNLPLIHVGPQLAAAMKIEIGTLRWLTFHRRGATVVHYHRYEIAKKTGGHRNISAPKPALKNAQSWILENILSKIFLNPSAHGFIPAHSIVTNAAPHVNRAAVINLDLKDFFPTITFRRVKGVFAALGYSEQIATILSLLCTEPPRVAADLHGKRYYIALGDRILPQGACTSPAITNILCRKLDKRLTGLAAKLNFTYTRYADDLTFSSNETNRINWLLRGVRFILKSEGFTEHAAKTHIMRRSTRQEVTGVTVNTRTTLSREDRRKLRAILHNAAKSGLASQNRTNRPDFAAYLKGKVAFAAMVDPQRAAQWRTALQKAVAQ